MVRTKGNDAAACVETVALAAAAVCLIAGFLGAFLLVAPAGGPSVQGAVLIGDVMVSQSVLLSQKIFFFHMPAALVSFAALTAGAWFSVRYLRGGCEVFDRKAKASLEIALLFVVMTMVTGELWTRFEWGRWWVWEPRLTTYLVLTLIVVAYFLLRRGIDDTHRRASLSAVVAVLAFVDVPICFMVTRLIPSSIHPVILREGGMTPEMGTCVAVVCVGMACLGFVLYRLRLRQALVAASAARMATAVEKLDTREIAVLVGDVSYTGGDAWGGKRRRQDVAGPSSRGEKE